MRILSFPLVCEVSIFIHWPNNYLKQDCYLLCHIQYLLFDVVVVSRLLLDTVMLTVFLSWTGTVVRRDCTLHSGTKCGSCEIRTYMNQPNGLNECFPCTSCDQGMSRMSWLTFLSSFPFTSSKFSLILTGTVRWKRFARMRIFDRK